MQVRTENRHPTESLPSVRPGGQMSGHVCPSVTEDWWAITMEFPFWGANTCIENCQPWLMAQPSTSERNVQSRGLVTVTETRDVYHVPATSRP